MNKRPLNICLDARLSDGMQGGIQQTIIGLAYGLSKLTDGDECYHFMVYPQSSSWLRPYIKGPCSLLPVVLPRGRKFNAFIERLPYREVWCEALRRLLAKRLKRLPVSTGEIESAGMDLMHFTFQSAFLTQLPSIYHIHDLQHEHCPQFFTHGEKALRNFRYQRYCLQASLTPVFFNWIRDELIRLYGIPEHKVAVIPYAPVVDAYPAVDDAFLIQVLKKYKLPQDFILYPAQTFPHKNHIGLIDALRKLRYNKKMLLPLVCTGMKTYYYKHIQSYLQHWEMGSQIRFLGFVPAADLKALYRLCRMMVFPSHYEGWGLPVTEALKLGVPTALSNIPALKEQAQDGAVYFNPEKPEDIMNAVECLWVNSDLRASVVKLGHLAVSRYSWEKTALTFRAHYRRLAKRAMTNEDWSLIQESI
jgi:glycosyltransferase involved in cell wall biosynthesis